MGKSRKKSTKKRKKTRKIKGGEPLTAEQKKSVKSFNKAVGAKDKVDTKCVDPVGIHKEDYKLPIWVYRLKLIYEHFYAEEKLGNRKKWLEGINKEDNKTGDSYKNTERQKWCGNSEKPGYCQTGKAWVHVNTLKNSKKRCLPGSYLPDKKTGKKGKRILGKLRHVCLVDLNLKEWWHCNKHCGRKKEKGEDTVSCDDIKVKIGKKEYSMNEAEEARN